MARRLPSIGESSLAGPPLRACARTGQKLSKTTDENKNDSYYYIMTNQCKIASNRTAASAWQRHAFQDVCARVGPRRRSGAADLSRRFSVEAIVAREDLRVFHLHRKLRDRFVGRRTHRRTGAQIEARTVARALDLKAVDVAARQLTAVVRADVLDRVQLAVDVEYRDCGVAVPGDFEFPGQQFGLGAD